ncbi:MAG: hypothetical protein AAF664_23920, partial [Planctomycetota bacterium]
SALGGTVHFLFGEKVTPESSNEAVESTTVIASSTSNEVLPQFKGRVPLTTRCRPELASALKRASLQRQLDDIEPNRMQDILESALEDWLRKNGYAQ